MDCWHWSAANRLTTPPPAPPKPYSAWRYTRCSLAEIEEDDEEEEEATTVMLLPPTYKHLAPAVSFPVWCLRHWHYSIPLIMLLFIVLIMVLYAMHRIP